jgi:hypothetical protein
MQGRLLLRRALTLAIALTFAGAAAARADTLTVNGFGEDDGPCTAGVCPSIRSALNQAAQLPGADTIVVPAGDYALGSALTVSSDVTLRGASARTTIVHGGGSYRVFEVPLGVTATISHLTMRDGTADNGNGCWGGNLRSEGTLLLDHIRSTNGRACSGAGLGNVGAAMTVQSSLIDSNSANIGGSDSGGILNLGRQDRPAQLTVRDTTIAFNQAAQTGGVFSWSYEGNIPNTTTLDRVTLAYNGGGGLRRGDDSQTFTVRGSIVQGTCAGGITSGGGNAESGSGCGFETQDDGALVSDALTAMGGETDVVAPGSSTAWIDSAGPCTGADQRDVARPQGAACDAGAIELDTVAPDAPVITSAEGGLLTGTAEPLATIEVLEGGSSLGTTTADGDGRWSFPIPAGGPHTYTARATDAAGNTSPLSAPRSIAVAAQTPAPTPTPSPTPTPVAGKTVVGAPVRGKVLVKLPGKKGFAELDGTHSIPLGSTIDTKKGTISLTARTGQSATFRDGIFKLTQTRTTTDLTLTEALAKCPKRGAAHAAAKKKPKTRKLWGNGSGSFRTRGQYSAATVRGTEWLVQDSCAGTLTRVRKGVVAVRDNVKRKTIVLRAGKKYLARPRR